MSLNKRYAVFVCKECEIDFIVIDRYKKKTAYCPNCGDQILVELVRHLTMEKPSNHHKRWTIEEDEILIESRKRKIYVGQIKIDGRTKTAIERRWRRLKEKGLTR